MTKKWSKGIKSRILQGSKKNMVRKNTYLPSLYEVAKWSQNKTKNFRT